MQLIFFLLFQLVIKFSKMYEIAKEKEINTYLPSSEYNYVHYNYIVKIDICEYDLNNSYVNQNDEINYFYDSFSKRYYSIEKIKIGGSDLKLIQSGVSSLPFFFRNLASSYDNELTVQKSFSHFKVDYKINSFRSFSLFYLYVIKNDNKDFINICDLLEYKNVKLEMEKEAYQLKTISFEFDLKSHFKSESYKIIIVEKTLDDIYYKRESIIIETSPITLQILLIFFGIIIIFILAIAIYIFIKRKINHKNNSDFSTPYKINENCADFNDKDYNAIPGNDFASAPTPINGDYNTFN